VKAAALAQQEAMESVCDGVIHITLVAVTKWTRKLLACVRRHAAVAARVRSPRVGHRHDAHVGLDGAERVVLRLRRLLLRQRVEESGLAHIGQAHDTRLELHGHCRAVAAATAQR
jgi:hypothetical protein